jgi:hypothetical protein
MAFRNSKSRFRHPIAPLILASSLVGGVAACSLTSDPPAVTRLPPTISAQAPETAVQGSESIAFYYDGVKTSVTIKDAAVLFAACTLNTNDSRKIVNFVNNTLKVGPITDADVTGLGDPLKPSVSDFTADGVVDCKDAAVLFAAISTGLPPTASKINSFLANTLKLSGVSVTQPHLDTLFREPTPTLTPTPAGPRITIPGLPAGATVTIRQADGTVIATSISVSGDVAIFPTSFTIPFGGQVRVTPAIPLPGPIRVGGTTLTIFDNTINPGSTTYFNLGPAISVN